MQKIHTHVHQIKIRKTSVANQCTKSTTALLVLCPVFQTQNYLYHKFHSQTNFSEDLWVQIICDYTRI